MLMVQQSRKAHAGEIRTKRWNDPPDAADGLRVLICRYRPRALPRADETWDVWWSDLAPSRALHADFYGKHGPPIGWTEYLDRYLREIESRPEAQVHLRALADHVRRGQIATLLCSSACHDPDHCHRTLVQGLIEKLRTAAPVTRRPA